MNKEKVSVFQRCGLAALSDLLSSEHQDLFSILEKDQNDFTEKEAEFRSKEYKWPRKPLYNFSRVWEYPYVYSHLESYLRTLPQGSNPLIVDVGSGVTFFPFSLAKLGYQVVCMDVDPICEKDLSLAAKCVSHSPGSVDFKLIKNDTFPLKDLECDAVYCISVIEHISDFEQTISEIGRILKPGGLCLITCDINLQPTDGLQLDENSYVRLMNVIDTIFDQMLPDRTIHPGNMLTTINSPYPLEVAKLGIVQIIVRIIKQKILKPLLGRKPGRVMPTVPSVAVFGLVLRKRA